MSWEFLSGNWQYWGNVRAPLASFPPPPPINILVGMSSSGIEKLFEEFLLGRKVRKHCSKVLAAGDEWIPVSVRTTTLDEL